LLSGFPGEDLRLKVSVVIPTYNSSTFIRSTLDSVFQQSLVPDEILVVDDGSTDDTVSILEAFEPRVRIVRQSNQGVSAARNALAKLAQGDFVAFLDHDDLWHRSYLEVQCNNLAKNPKAVASITGHADFRGYGNFDWMNVAQVNSQGTEVMAPLDFLKRYNKETGDFGSMSFIVAPKRVLVEMGSEPFQISGVDDSYFCTTLPLMGDVIFTPARLVAYRITRESQSADWLKSARLWLKVFERLEHRYSDQERTELRKVFRVAFATKRRRYARLLMGAGQREEGRQQFRLALRCAGDWDSLVRSVFWFGASCLPQSIQPKWPESSRESTLEANSK
jgi:glycosyltransferase involved in cell wall biosynthesis